MNTIQQCLTAISLLLFAILTLSSRGGPCVLLVQKIHKVFSYFRGCRRGFGINFFPVDWHLLRLQQINHMGATTSFLSRKNKYNDKGSKIKIDREEETRHQHRIIGKMQLVKKNRLLQADFCQFLVHEKGKLSCLKLFQDYENVRNQLLNNHNNANCLPNGQINFAEVDIPSPDQYTKSTDDFEIRFLLRTSLYQLEKLKTPNTTHVSINTVYKQLVAAEDVLLQNILEDFEDFITSSQSIHNNTLLARGSTKCTTKSGMKGNEDNEDEGDEEEGRDGLGEIKNHARGHSNSGVESEIMYLDEIMQKEQRLFLSSFTTSVKDFPLEALHPIPAYDHHTNNNNNSSTLPHPHPHPSS